MIAKRFEEQVKKNPDKVAVKTGKESITYNELNRYADRIAHKIKETRPNHSSHLQHQLVGLFFKDAVDMIAAVIGILKAGKAYVPLSSDYPPQRLSYMISHSELSLILTDSPSINLAKKIVTGNPVVICDVGKLEVVKTSPFCPDGSHGYTGKDEELMYILYTSGSTGKPKGVMQSQRSVLYFIDRYAENLSITHNDRMTLFSSFSHDAAVMDLYGALLKGATLFPLNIMDLTDFSSLSQWLIKEGITIWHSVPTVYRYFVRSLNTNVKETYPQLRFIVLGGEAVIRYDIEMFYKLFPYAVLYNLYGQTESSYNSGMMITPQNTAHQTTITLGEVVKGTRIFVLDGDGRPVDALETGEIIVASPYVSPGYWKDGKATRESFREHPRFGRLYRTGDLGCLLLDGRIEFVGRKDSQVKIRGFRVELGEIETFLRTHPAIHDAVVGSKVDDADDKYLCAYIVLNPTGTFEKMSVTADLREYLSLQLPDYMVPTYFVQLDRLPLTATGKVDRKALPEPKAEVESRCVAPRDAIEEKMIRIWSKILGMPPAIGIDDNFFQLGGHSLKATLLAAAIHKELKVKLPLAVIFKTPTIRELSEYTRGSVIKKYTAIEPVEKKEYYPLSSAQTRFYILQRVTPESTAYNMTQLHQLAGNVKKEKFEDALKALIERHETLRTCFQLIGGQPVQRIHDEVEFEIEYYDENLNTPRPLRGHPSQEGNKSASHAPCPMLHASTIKNFIRPFDLSQAPLLRLGLIRISQNRHILMFTMHHIITDGTSMTIFLREFMALYSGGDLPLLALQYKDFAQWQSDRLKSGKLKEQEAYWLERFSGELPVLNMPTDFPRPPVQSFEGDRFNFILEKSLTPHLNRLIRETGTTLNMVLLAVYNILLARYTGQEDIIIGTTIAGRSHTELENIIGLLIETLALRNYPSGDRTFGEFLNNVKQGTLEAYENQDYPFKELIKRVGAENEISRNPVFDGMLIVQNFEVTDFELEGLRFFSYEFPEDEAQHMSKVDFTLSAVESGEEIYFDLEYCTRLYKRETMELFAQHFINIIKEIVKDPGIRLSAVQMISENEKNQLLEEFNNTALEYTRSKMVHESFARQADRTPDYIALSGALRADLNAFGEENSFTYRELNKKSDQLAYVLKEKGVQPDTIVGIMVEPSVEMVIGLLGILKSGGAYLPIDADYPEDRIKYMLEDSKVKVLLAAPETEVKVEVEERCGQPQELTVETSLSTLTCQVSPANLAYVIYTSGTTGRPKGVLVEHQNLTAYINAFEKEFHLREDDTVVQQVSYAFDAFVEELYPILLKGGKLAIPGREVIKDIQVLCNFIEKHRVTMITCSPQLLNELNNFSNRLDSLRILISGGDRLKAEYIGNFMGVGEVYNTYGPTESAVCATYYRCPRDSQIASNVPIGKPITNYQVYILNKYGNLLPVGVGGELCVAGGGVTRGYLNKPELTNSKFQIPNFRQMSYMSHMSHMSYIYKTGDLARWLNDGNIEFLGRIDRQVKIRGYRIELGEIENCLMRLDHIDEAVVVEGVRTSGQNYLAAYVVCRESPDLAEVKNQLARQLPDYMVPPYIMEIEEIPLTSPGKVDRRRLPRADVRPDQPYAAPESNKEKIVAEIWKEVLEKDRVGLEDNFFDLGGTSLDIFKINTRINEKFNRQIPVVAMFQHSTVRTLARYLGEEENEKGISWEKQKELSEALDKSKATLAAGGKSTGLEIAVIGMAGIFPGSHNIAEFWENLKNGVEGIGFFTDEELQAEGIAAETLKNPNYIKARGIIQGAEYFDSSFFGYTPLEARIMDPQMRIFTHCIWHALEDAGYDPFSFDRRIGLYAGASPNLQWEGLISFSSIGQGLDAFMVAQLADKDFMCTHISYKLNLKGPSVSIQTACSTSLVAIHWAVQGLLHGECEMALAGGVSVNSPSKRGYFYKEGMIYSNDGHNKTFDSEATGSVFGDGAGVVVLKRLEEATADRDNIYAVIKGSAINNDGFRKVGYTAPSIDGQAEVIKAAQLMAEVEPGSITYIEAHGTATRLGDTVEIEALKQAFNTGKKGFCGIGTVKSNLGHLYSAAGVAGFIKTVLSLKHRLIPPSLHFKTPNPEIDFENSPFYVNTELKEWKNNGYPLRAGVSSFGIGGTNAHVILEEAPKGTRGLAPLPEYHLILLSAKTPTALEQQTKNLMEYLNTNPGINLADMAYTLQVGRKHFPYRRMFVCPTLAGNIDKLFLYIKKIPTGWSREENRPIVFMFCGQGSQYVNMGIDLYRTESIFRKEMDRCFEIIKPLTGFDLKEILYPGEATRTPGHQEITTLAVRSTQLATNSKKIYQTEITQPVLFAFEYALAKLLMRWGIKPRAMIGYSFGEYIAACISGVISLEDALKLVIMRGRLTQQTPAGAMTSVPLPEKELKPLLNKNLWLAIVNGPTCIVSGAKEAVEAFEKEMKKKRVLCVSLNMSQAIHSGLMEPIREEFENRISESRFNNPQIPYISNVTAGWITGEEATNPGYWGDHLCSTVRFSDGLKELLKEDNTIFIEIGPGRILGMMVKTHPDKKPGHMVLNTVKHQQEKVRDDYFLLDKVGQLWLCGQRINWSEFYGEEKRNRISLPTYPFEGKRYWLDRDIGSFNIGAGIQVVSQSSETAPGLEPSPGVEDLESLERPDENDEAPRNESEQMIARMWQELLGIDRIGIHDDFFYLNGSSLVATQLIARLIEEYQVEIPMNKFYENPTIAHLAEVIKELSEE
ncbi:MAG: amino acid adenylation domain-containing protein [Candidatus Aminicenantes bacterium]|nr:MAG: amino acid adenylation domain-containing protein [Candidatus Aminicenantes bacterium]